MPTKTVVQDLEEQIRQESPRQLPVPVDEELPERNIQIQPLQLPAQLSTEKEQKEQNSSTGEGEATSAQNQSDEQTQPNTDASSTSSLAHLDQPIKGTLWFIGYTLQLSAGSVVSKALYKRNPDITAMQVLALRSAIGIVFLLIAFNRHLKSIMYDGVVRGTGKYVFAKTLQSSISTSIMLYSTQFFSVSLVSIVTSLAPILVILGACLFLKEKITFYTVFSVVIVISCVVVVMSGAEGEEGAAMGDNIPAFALLCAQPLLIAAGQVVSRKMRENHCMVLSCYGALLQAVFACSLVQLVAPIDLELLYSIDAVSWILITLSALATIFETTTKILALRYQEAAKLQKMTFLNNVWNFVMDLIWQTPLSAVQYAGFGSLFAFYTFELFRNICEQKMKKSRSSAPVTPENSGAESGSAEASSLEEPKNDEEQGSSEEAEQPLPPHSEDQQSARSERIQPDNIIDMAAERPRSER